MPLTPSEPMTQKKTRFVPATVFFGGNTLDIRTFAHLRSSACIFSRDLYIPVLRCEAPNGTSHLAVMIFPYLNSILNYRFTIFTTM